MAPKTKKPCDDTLVAYNFRLSRKEAADLDAARHELEAEAGYDLPMAQVLRRICRDFVKARAARKSPGR